MMLGDPPGGTYERNGLDCSRSDDGGECGRQCIHLPRQGAADPGGDRCEDPHGQLNQLDSTFVAQSIADDLIKKGATDVHVKCPAMSGAPGSVHLCTVTTHQGDGHARVTVENAAGDITWLILG